MSRFLQIKVPAEASTGIHCPLCGQLAGESERCGHVRFIWSGVEPSEPIFAVDEVRDYISNQIDHDSDEQQNYRSLYCAAPEDVAMFVISANDGKQNHISLDACTVVGFSLTDEELDSE